MKSLKVILTFFLYVIVFYVHGQIRWNNIYLTGKDPFITDVIESYDKGYLLIGQYGPNYPSFNWLIKTDINGEILWNKTFGSIGVATILSGIELNSLGDSYIAGSTYFYGQNNSDPFIMKLNSCGEKIWCKVFIEDDDNYTEDFVVTNDGGVTVVMYLSIFPYSSNRVCLARLDINGELQWKYCYNSTDSRITNQQIYDLLQTPDGGYLISGRCYYQDSVPPFMARVKPYYIKTDSLGNLEWETVVDKDITSQSGVAWTTVVNADSNYYYSSTSHYNLSQSGDTPALLKMDLSGNLIDIYHLAPLGNYGKMVEAKFISDSTLIASAVWGNGPPKAVVIDTLGNILNSTFLLNNEWMAQTEVTFDDKLLFFTNIHDNSDNFDAFLFKLNQQLESDTLYLNFYNYDSLCPYQIVSDTIVQDGCGLIVGLEELYSWDNDKEHKLSIYPNPARTKFTLKCEAFEYHSTTIVIFDFYGQQLLTLEVPKGQIEAEVNIEGWKKGLYLVHIWSEGNFTDTGKVLVH